MYSDFVLIDQSGAASRRWSRLPLGQTGGRSEAWLRDLAIAHPDLLPVRDIDPAFGPLIPLCTELRTEAGAIDAAFINRDGKLTIVECKLWRNPEARRTVVAQTLDYARALTRWSYSDLQRQVSARVGKSGNVPFARVQERHPELVEHEFIDAVGRSLRSGRFLMVVLGDGIREDVEAIAELINRNAAAAFQLAVVETALYDAGEDGVAVQTRVLARTRLIERAVYIASEPGLPQVVQLDEEISPMSAANGARSPEIREWWSPVLDMRFDDPDQPPPAHINNYVRSPLPWPGLSVAAYRTVKGDETAVYLGGPVKARRTFLEALEPEFDALRDEIPGLVVRVDPERDIFYVHVPRSSGEFPSPDAHRTWIIETMNQFANALRPRMKRLLAGM